MGFVSNCILSLAARAGQARPRDCFGQGDEGRTFPLNSTVVVRKQNCSIFTFKTFGIGPSGDIDFAIRQDQCRTTCFIVSAAAPAVALAAAFECRITYCGSLWTGGWMGCVCGKRSRPICAATTTSTCYVG